MHHPLASLGLAAFVLTSVVIGCSSSDDNGGAGTYAQGTLGATACAQCINSQCRSEMAACNADSACNAYTECIFSCPAKNSHEADETCTESCEESESAPSEAYFSCYKAFLEEERTGCETPCD